MDASILDKLADKFTVGDGCWEWTAARTSGYGILRVPGIGTRRAHRLLYEALVGPIPAGLQLDHLCRNKGCVRPDHLEPVTSAENTRRGESTRERHAARTHCIHGHEYTDENTFRVKSTGRRFCRTCHNRSQQASR